MKIVDMYLECGVHLVSSIASISSSCTEITGFVRMIAGSASSRCHSWDVQCACVRFPGGKEANALGMCVFLVRSEVMGVIITWVPEAVVRPSPSCISLEYGRGDLIYSRSLQSAIYPPCHAS